MLPGSLKLGNVMGIPIRLHFSWFVIFGLITWALATRYFPQVAPELSQSTNWIRGAVAALMLFLSVTIHELSHSIVARGYNIPISSITLFIFGGVAQMDKEPSSPKIEMNMALAGPFSSYVLALIFYVIILFPVSPWMEAVFYGQCSGRGQGIICLQRERHQGQDSFLGCFLFFSGSFLSLPAIWEAYGFC
jgi:Zn-dependent protease